MGEIAREILVSVPGNRESCYITISGEDSARQPKPLWCRTVLPCQNGHICPLQPAQNPRPRPALPRQYAAPRGGWQPSPGGIDPARRPERRARAGQPRARAAGSLCAISCCCTAAQLPDGCALAGCIRIMHGRRIHSRGLRSFPLPGTRCACSRRGLRAWHGSDR